MSEPVEPVVEEETDLIKAFKDLRYYQISDEWKELEATLVEMTTKSETAIRESRGDTEIKYSTHCVMWARQELYSNFLKKITDEKASYLCETLIKEIDAILSQILYKIFDRNEMTGEIGQSLDVPMFSKTDLVRWDLQSIAYLQRLLENTINTLDPNGKNTRTSMNPYDETYSNAPENNPAPEQA